MRYDDFMDSINTFRNILLRTNTKGELASLTQPHMTQVIFADGQKMFFNVMNVDWSELERSINNYNKILKG
jgi:hypothetical protein